VSSSEPLLLPPILLSNFSWLYRYIIGPLVRFIGSQGCAIGPKGVCYRRKAVCYRRTGVCYRPRGMCYRSKGWCSQVTGACYRVTGVCYRVTVLSAPQGCVTGLQRHGSIGETPGPALPPPGRSRMPIRISFGFVTTPIPQKNHGGARMFYRQDLSSPRGRSCM